MYDFIDPSFVRRHKATIAIFMFLVLFTAVHYAKPGFAYGPDGEFRQFGVGYRNKTVVPIWTVAIVLAILCYLAVLYYVSCV